MRAAIHRYEPKVGIHIQEQHAIGVLDDLEGQGARAVTRNPTDDAQGFWIDGRSQIVLQGRGSGRCQRQLESRQVLADVPDGRGRQ